MTTNRFVPRFEYSTREMPPGPEAVSSAAHADMEQAGWHRVWSDITVEGSYHVYRRQRQGFVEPT